MVETSIIIPCYNHAAFIAEAIQSVLDQSISDWELIVIDDGSTDRSADIIKTFTEPRLKFIQQANQGAHAAINRGLHEASGDYLSILNSDDLFRPLRMQKSLAELKKDPQVGLVGSFIEIINEKGQPVGIKHGYKDHSPWPLPVPQRSFRAGDDLHAALLTENYWSTTSNFVFSRAWFQEVGDFQPLRFTHDWDFALRLARRAALVLIPEPLLCYRQHSQNTIRQDRPEMIFEICWCLAVHLPGYFTSAWSNEIPPGQRIDSLLHSIYTFGMDNVLSTMLLQRLADHPEAALQLLDPQDPNRLKYLEFIREELSRQLQPGQSTIPDQLKRKVRSEASRLRRKLAHPSRGSE